MTGVYRVYAFSDGPEVIYVGMSSGPRIREASHRTQSQWWTPDLKFDVLSDHETKVEAFAAELEQIQLHQPIHNVRGNPRYNKDGATPRRLATNDTERCEARYFDTEFRCLRVAHPSWELHFYVMRANADEVAA